MSTREAILSAARDLLLAEGLPGVSLRAVGRRAGLSATAAYRYFDNKEDLLWGVVLEGHEVFARYLARGLRGRDARERLLLTGSAYADFALEHRAWYLVMFVAPPEHLGYASLAARSEDEGVGTFQMLVDRVRETMDAGVLLRGDPAEVSLTIWAHVHGLVTLYYRVPESVRDGQRGDAPALGVPPAFLTPEAFRAWFDRSVASLLRGLAAGS